MTDGVGGNVSGSPSGPSAHLELLSAAAAVAAFGSRRPSLANSPILVRERINGLPVVQFRPRAERIVENVLDACDLIACK
jgi:hypothetical protein